MKDFGVRVACLNRFRTPSEQNKILADTQKGETDLLIGTHRLLSDDVKFHDLGLLILDEEQRFGVELPLVIGYVVAEFCLFVGDDFPVFVGNRARIVIYEVIVGSLVQAYGIVVE